MLNRQTLISAVRMGIRKSEGKSLEDRVVSVIDAIDIAIELQGIQQEMLAPPVESQARIPPSPIREVEPPPPNPNSISASLEEVPVQDSLIVLPTETETNAVIEEHSKKEELRVKSLFIGKGKPKVGLTHLMEWAALKFPVQIRIVPKGRNEPIILERNLVNIPCSGEGRNKEIESTIKVAYKHPSLGSDMEVGQSIRVGDCQEGWPDQAVILEAVKAQAVELYKARPQRIDGFAPAGPDLNGQHRMLMNAARAQQRPAQPIAMADADHTARPDIKVVE